jgi:hypothetical protein
VNGFRAGHPPSSRASQARASRQSRCTLCSDIPSTRAVSSTLEASEKTQLDDPGLALIERGQGGEGLVDGDEPGLAGRGGQVGGEGDTEGVTAAALGEGRAPPPPGCGA